MLAFPLSTIWGVDTPLQARAHGIMVAAVVRTARVPRAGQRAGGLPSLLPILPGRCDPRRKPRTRALADRREVTGVGWGAAFPVCTLSGSSRSQWPRALLSPGTGSMNSTAARSPGEWPAGRNRRETWDTRRGDRDLGPSPGKPPFPYLEQPLG